MSVEALFAALADYAPDEPVLIGDRETWTTQRLKREIEALADALASRRAVAVLADNGPAWVVADLAALRAGVTHVPLPGFFSDVQIAHVIDQSGADTVLTSDPARIVALERGFRLAGAWQGLAWLTRAAPAAARLRAGTAKISFTSGSTGEPKGVCLGAQGLIDTAQAVVDRLAGVPIRRHLAVLPLALLLENSAGIYAPLLRRAAIHVPELATLGWRGMAGFDPAALQGTVARLGPDSAILVPELLKAWSLYLAATGQRAPAGLSYVAVGGARVDASLIERARALGLPVYQGYGLTECGSVVSLNCPADPDAGGDDVGRPLAHVHVSVHEGEVRIASRAFLGYLGEGAAVAQGFATGDLGHVDGAGHLRLTGRRKNLIITSYGRNVAPEWVEATLLAQPAVRQAVVAGEGRPRLSAVLVPAPGVDRTALAAAVAAANAALPDYARIAAWVSAPPFTSQNGLVTGNGRPIRAAILSHYAAALAALYQTKESVDVVL
jgi:long-subunit acyl-CoA synthetase (AMP-forming)